MRWILAGLFLVLTGVAGAFSGGAIAATTDAPIVLGDALYEPVAGWCKLPSDRPLGNTHGGIVIDGAGHVYYNTDTDRSIMVHRPDGTFVRACAGRHPALHSMVIREEDGTEFIYAAHLPGKQAVKLRLDGTLVWAIGVPMESGKYQDPDQFNPTGVAVGPDGRIYVADGYGQNWIHIFGPDLTYQRSFGGWGDGPGQFKTCHTIALDPRDPDRPLLVVCDRENRRLQRFDLDGNFVDVAATGLRRPCALAFWRDRVAVAELEGRVTILDDAFEVVGHQGDNPDEAQWAKNGVPASDWEDGVFTAPHGVCFDADGNLYVMDWNSTGRISKLARVSP